jgi:uncharacterized membrane protein YgcG
MMKTNIASKINLICSIALVGIILPAAIVKGESGYPRPVDDYVNDYTGVLDTPDAEQIHEMLGKLEDKTGIEGVVVTINSIRDYATGDTTIESFATNLFNTWGIGDREKNNGFLILVAVKDRRCRIELGAGYGRRYDSAMKRVIDKKMIPHFKADDHSLGIYEGCSAVIRKLTRKFPWGLILAGILIAACVAGAIFYILSLRERGRVGGMPKRATLRETAPAGEVPSTTTWHETGHHLRETGHYARETGQALRFIFELIAGLLEAVGNGDSGGGSSFGGGASGSW